MAEIFHNFRCNLIHFSIFEMASIDFCHLIELQALMK